MPEKLPELAYPGYFKTALVHHNGVIHHQGHRVYISGLLRKEKVGLEEISGGVWEIYYGPLRLGRFNMRAIKKKLRRYAVRTGLVSRHFIAGSLNMVV